MPPTPPPLDPSDETPVSRAEVGAWGLFLAAGALLIALPGLPRRVQHLTTDLVEAPASCALADGPCSAAFDDGSRVTLAVTPGRAPADTPLDLAVTVAGDLHPTHIVLTGADMAMGRYEIPLAPDGERWTARTALPVCTTGAMRWRFDVVADDRVAGFVVETDG